MEQLINRFITEFSTPFHNSVLIFTVILIIIFISPLLLRRIKVPGIIVLILLGLVIGPHGFNLIERNDAVVLFSTIGLLYIMFLAGLELNLTEFARNKHKSLLFGAFTFAIPMLIGFPVCYYLLGYNLLSSLLTASMFATHTLIAYPIVSKMELTKNEAVAITVGGTIITDTAVLMILAVINSTQTNAGGWEHWLTVILSFSLFFIFIFKLVPIVARWVLKRVENERYSHFIYVLATVFFSAFVAELAGLEPIIGAFLAGLVINRLIPKSSPLMHRIEFAGNALFIPFFLISVGMIIDLKSLFGGTGTLMVAGALTVAALLGKWLAAKLTALLLKYTNNQQKLIFGLSSSHAVATLAVITVGFKMGILDNAILNGTIILILVTCIIGSLVTENAARAILIQQEKQQPAQQKTGRTKVLVPIANPATMTDLMDLALNLTDQKDHSPVIALSVVDDDQQAGQKLAESREILDKLIKHGAETERKVEIVTTIDQNTSNGIRRVITEVNATDIVIGTSPKSRFTDLIFGNLITNILSQTNQQIYVYKPLSPTMGLTAIRILCPPYSEKESGFGLWLNKMSSLAFNLNIPCHFYGNENLLSAARSELAKSKVQAAYTYKTMDVLNEQNQLNLQDAATDLIVFIKARQNSVSYSANIQSLLEKLELNLPANSLLVITPYQHAW